MVSGIAFSEVFSHLDAFQTVIIHVWHCSRTLTHTGRRHQTSRSPWWYQSVLLWTLPSPHTAPLWLQNHWKRLIKKQEATLQYASVLIYKTWEKCPCCLLCHVQVSSQLSGSPADCHISWHSLIWLTFFCWRQLCLPEAILVSFERCHPVAHLNIDGVRWRGPTPHNGLVGSSLKNLWRESKLTTSSFRREKQ